MPEPSLVIQLLGPPRITVGAAPLKVDTRKAVAVLAYLVATEQPQAREHLAALLWPEADDAAARGALRRTLSTLKSALGSRHLVIERGSVRIERRDIEADVWKLRMAADERLDGPTDAAVVEAALRGEFMAGFGLRDAPEFDDWVMAQADAWRQRSIAILDRAAERQAAAGDLGAAIETARRRIELDRLDEGAHRQLMTLYARAGDRAGALRQYRSCVRVLSEELDVEPLAATTALHEAILAGSAFEESTERPDTVAATDRSPAALPFVGREAEMRLLLNAWRSRDARLVVVEGEAGIGKTRLATELSSRVEREGGRFAELRGYPARHATPYAPVSDLLEGRLRSGPGQLEGLDPAIVAELARLVPGVGPRAAGISPDGPGAEARFTDALATTLRLVAGDLLVVDDAQWIDPASLLLVAQVARSATEGRPLVVVLRRPVDPPQDPLLTAIARARRAGDLLVLELRRLTEAEVRRAVQPAAPELDVRALHAESDGVPFYLAERLAALRGGAPAGEIPAGIRDLVRTRVVACGAAARQVLAAAAVIGGGFDPELVREVSGRPTEEVADAIDELAAHRIVLERQGSLELDHELTRSVVLDDLGMGRRRLLHRRAADALIRRVGRRRAPADVAAHLQAAGDDARAAEWFEAAGEHASQLHAHADAIEHFESALALSVAPHGRLHERIAERLMLLGRYADAVGAWEAAAATLPPTEAWRAELGLARAHRRLGNFALATAHLDDAGGGRDPERAGVEVERALIADRTGDGKMARRHAEAALAIARELGEPLALAQAHNLCGLLARHRGQSAQARRHLAAALEIAGTLDQPAARMASLNNLALLEMADGALDVAEARLRQALTLAVATRDRHHEAALRNNLADVLNAAGRRDEAISEVARSATILAELGGLAAGGDGPSAEVWRLVDW